MFSKVYELPLSRNYVRHWGMAEAIRELIQNALDSNSPFEYEFIPSDDGVKTLVLTSRLSKLEPSTLLLGATGKADDDESIGSFGEGYKIALLVLTREGFNVDVLNGEKVWMPSFKMSRAFGEETLCITESANPNKHRGLSFAIHGLTDDHVDQVVASCIQMQNFVGQVIETSRGTIMLDRPGKLYVGGLFICDTELKYGYNIKPAYLKLERDRQTVSNWNLREATTNMWFETERNEQIAKMISENFPDVSYAEYGSPQLVKEECYKLFKAQHPGHVVATSQTELRQLVAQGMEKVVYVGDNYGTNVKASTGYSTARVVHLATPTERLDSWFAVNRKHMRKDALVSWKKLLEESAGWRLK